MPGRVTQHPAFLSQSLDRAKTWHYAVRIRTCRSEYANSCRNEDQRESPRPGPYAELGRPCRAADSSARALSSLGWSWRRMWGGEVENQRSTSPEPRDRPFRWTAAQTPSARRAKRLPLASLAAVCAVRLAALDRVLPRCIVLHRDSRVAHGVVVLAAIGRSGTPVRHTLLPR
jgi:hypothetical protein